MCIDRNCVQCVRSVAIFSSIKLLVSLLLTIHRAGLDGLRVEQKIWKEEKTTSFCCIQINIDVRTGLRKRRNWPLFLTQ